jgi:hypothetical protein
MSCQGWGRHWRGSFAAGWEVAEAHDGILFDVLNQAGFGTGWSAFEEAGVEGVFGAFVGEQKMLDDLLDGPTIGTRRRTQLGLGGVEAMERTGDFVLELLEIGVHVGRITLHVLETCGQFSAG